MPRMQGEKGRVIGGAESKARPPSLHYQTLITLVGKRIGLTRNNATDIIFIINYYFLII
jgi:hypothetical protein